MSLIITPKAPAGCNIVGLVSNGIEKTMDIAGCVPGISTATGLLRIIYGISKVAFNKLRSSFESDYYKRQEYEKRIDKGWAHVKLGGLEMVPGGKLVAVVVGGFALFLVLSIIGKM